MNKKGKWNGDRKGPPLGVRYCKHPISMISIREVLPNRRLGPNLIKRPNFTTDLDWSVPCNYGEVN